MTGGAFLWTGFIEKHGLAFDHPSQLVAPVATNVLVRALQWKCGPLVMVKQRGLPFCAVVALGAGRYLALGKLPAVDVLMTVLTFRGRSFEVHVDQTCFLIGGLVAVHASGGPMRAQQRK